MMRSSAEIRLLVQDMLDAELYRVGVKASDSIEPTAFQRAVLEEIQRRNLDLSRLLQRAL